MDDELDADEGEDRGDSVVEVDELVDEPSEQEVQLTQSHEGEHVRGEHEERILCDAEDRRNRVEREHHIGRADGDEHDEHRGPVLLVVVEDDTQLVAVVFVDDVDPLPQEPDEAVLAVPLVFGAEGLTVGDDEEEDAEDEEDFDEGADDRRTREDEDAAEDDGDDDAHHEHFLLVLPRYREAAHDDDEDEQIVDAQRVLEQPAGEEFAAMLSIADGEERTCEDQSQGDVEGDPDARFPHRRGVWSFDDQKEVEDEDRNDDDSRGDHEPDGNRRFTRCRIVAAGCECGGQDIHGCLSW